MAAQIAIEPARLEEAVTTVTAEYEQLSADKANHLTVVKGETEEYAYTSDFTAGFTVVTDALSGKADNILRELENYSKAITIAREELTNLDETAAREIKNSAKQTAKG